MQPNTHDEKSNDAHERERDRRENGVGSFLLQLIILLVQLFVQVCSRRAKLYAGMAIAILVLAAVCAALSIGIAIGKKM